MTIFCFKVGGATGRIGDPSGKATERTLLDEDTLARNVQGMLQSCILSYLIVASSPLLTTFTVHQI